MSKVRDALRKAQGDVDQLQAKVVHWRGVVDEKRAELAALEAGVGTRLFDDETGTALREFAASRNDLATEIDGAQAAAEVAVGRLRAAEWALMEAQAMELHEQAAKIRGEAEQRQAKVEELVAALVEYEGGGDWRPWHPTSEDLLMAGAAGIPVSERKTPPMFAEADRLDRQASLLEGQVEAERRKVAVAVPRASLHWDGRHDHGHWTVVVEAGLSEGVGSATFEVLRRGQVVHSVALPDGTRRAFRKLVEGFHGDTVEVRADGVVIASQTVDVPADEVNLSHPLSIR